MKTSGLFWLPRCETFKEAVVQPVEQLLFMHMFFALSDLKSGEDLK